jgi:hypothetical protein
LNSKTKKFIHVPQCTDGDSVHTALQNYKLVEQIVETVGVGALWIGKRLAERERLVETKCDEFTTCSSRAGIAITARTSPEATAAMWNDALVTKPKWRKISNTSLIGLVNQLQQKKMRLMHWQESCMSNIDIASTRFCLDKAKKNLMMT